MSHSQHFVKIFNCRKLRRKVGIAVTDLGGNAVLGYKHNFDLEGDHGKGIVARGYGTACYIARDNGSDAKPIITESVSPTPHADWVRKLKLNIQFFLTFSFQISHLNHLEVEQISYQVSIFHLGVKYI